MSNGKKLGIVLLCLLLLLSLGFLLLQDRIIDPDGGIKLPWSEEETSEPPQKIEKLPEGELEIIIEAPRRQETGELRALELDESVLRGGTESALARIEEMGANALSVRVKDVGGKLYYSSAIPEAAQADAIIGNAVSDGAIRDLVASEYHSIARVAALHDSAFAYRYFTDAAIIQLQYPGVVWYDPDSTFWLDPEKELTRHYLTEIVKECASLGFDEVLLDEFAYPSKGRLSNIDVSGRTMTQEEALEHLAAALKEALEGSEVKLSIELSAETVLNGGDELAGQNVALLAAYFDRIYVAAAPQELDTLRAALGETTAEFIPIVTDTPQKGGYLLKNG